MSLRLALATLLLAAIPAFAGDNALTDEQRAEGWKMLFDGKSLDGWSIKSGYATYKVDKGSIEG